MGSIWLGAFVGFLVILVLAFLFPGIGHLVGGFIGGLVAGLVARGVGRGLVAGFLAGIFGGIIISNSSIHRTRNRRGNRWWICRRIIWRLSWFSSRRSSDCISHICRHNCSCRRPDRWSDHAIKKYFFYLSSMNDFSCESFSGT